MIIQMGIVVHMSGHSLLEGICGVVLVYTDEK